MSFTVDITTHHSEIKQGLQLAVGTEENAAANGNVERIITELCTDNFHCCQPEKYMVTGKPTPANYSLWRH